VFPNYEGSTTDLERFINVLYALDKFFANTERKLLILFDGVHVWHKIRGKEDVEVANILRSILRVENITCFYCGSQRRLVETLFNDSYDSDYWSSLYNLAVGVPDEGELRAFIKRSFKETGKSISPTAVDLIFSYTGITTESIQELAYFTWADTMEGQTANEGCVQRGLENVIKNHASIFRRDVSRMLLEDDKVKNRLYLALSRSPVPNPRSRLWLNDFGFPKDQNRKDIQNYVDEMIETGILVQLDDGTYTVSDPFFGLWYRSVMDNS
jgi:hypothetical protein